MLRVYAFPGQGSQGRGMGADLFKAFPDYVRRADRIMGYSIEELCLGDDSARLLSTRYTQPALFTVNALSFLQRRLSGEPMADVLIGHSLGEYNALFAAGAFDFETGLRLVRKRGELMDQAQPGGMAAILGLSERQVEEVLAANGADDIDIANYNGPQQTIIAGPTQSLEAAEAYFDDGAVTYIPLNVGAAFHSRSMRSIVGEFSRFLEGFEYRPLSTPVIANVDAEFYRDGQIVEKLTAQVWQPVRWMDCVRRLMADGELHIEEVGPGSVLTGLVTTILRDCQPLKRTASANVDGL